ncbi:hypothetical protein RJ639_018794 [Escallonia herrerae]|uniref:Uncharacterized protein n=1 Tax=Escallonia herrerae TaxID=1293975 RepID=A0AA88V7Z3_9ASTE|nr:hypothetical protein RJ639_018794 [Escallonia herrerae]
MSKLPEITSLFEELVSNLQTLSPNSSNDGQSPDLSDLIQSLNLTEQPGVRVLDAALSLMCFTAPQVFESSIEYLVKTIVTVLSSSVKCDVTRLMLNESCNAEGKLSCLLLYAVTRVAFSASCFQHASRSAPVLDVMSIGGWSPALSKLFFHFPKEIYFENQEKSLRLPFWYLDPLILKHDLSQILQEAIKRPLLCLNMELYEKVEWRSMIICLVLSTAMFIETRALLHNWFLATGMASVLQLQIELTSLVLDVISRPMWWGISAEVGLKLPFSHAYFPYNQKISRVLAGALSCGGLLQLVHSISKSVSQARRHSDPIFIQPATKFGIVDHKSLWAMAMNFPDWFYFASGLLFSEKMAQDSSHSNCSFGAAENESHFEGLPCSAAARYIAWILNPISESHQDLLADCLNKISGSLVLEQFDKNRKAPVSYKKKPTKPKFHNEDDTALEEYGCQTIRLWLEEFQDVYNRYCNGIVNSSASCKSRTSSGFALQQNVLFRRISLGILIGYSNYVSEEGCEPLLHYAATGTILDSPDTQNAGLKHRNQNSDWQEDSITTNENYSRKEAMAGACLVFHFVDATEIKIDEDDGKASRDLYSRLVRWKHQGQDVLQGYKDLDDAIDALKRLVEESRPPLEV